LLKKVLWKQAVAVSAEGSEGKNTDFTQETSLTVGQYDIE
jgi:hypothetical protein